MARIRAEVIMLMRGHKEYPSKLLLKALLKYEPDTGKLFWRVDRPGRCKAGSEAGCVTNRGYITVSVDGINYQAHNLIWIMSGNELPTYPKTIDHADRNGLNNRITNLREATKRQQVLNRAACGFGWHRGRWQARSGVLDKEYIGCFPTALQARLAYEKVTSSVEPEFASTFFTDAINELIRSAC